MTETGESGWPVLPAEGWDQTRDTLHLWTQVVGKVRMALEPMVNHWWHVPLYVSARGLTTSLMHSGRRGIEIEFDFLHHQLEVRTTDDDVRRVALEPRTVASFYTATMQALTELDLNISIVGRPNEITDAIQFARDEIHRSYDPAAVHRYWIALVQIHRVLSLFRGRFLGKASPVHFFWGSADICTTRFSGRRAPKHPGGVPNCPDQVQELACSHELSSCGYWHGGGEGAFYAYAYPEPDGYANWLVEPADACYDASLGEFVLPYEAVRSSADPDGTLLSFLQSTYDAAASLASWNRAALELAN
jgi:Family of unknown function (DUF5996)